MLRALCLFAILGSTVAARAESQFVSCDNGIRCVVAPCPSRDPVELGPGKRVAMIAPDSGARYLSTALFAAD